MKIISRILALVLVPLCCHAADDIADNLKRDFTDYIAAVESNDYSTVVGFIHPRAIAAMGGRQRMIQGLKSAQAQLRASGMSIRNIQPEKPSERQTIGTEIVALLPHRIVMDAPTATIEMDSTLLCVSEDKGAHWRFADVGSFTPAQFARVFPTFARVVTLPPKKQPVIKKK